MFPFESNQSDDSGHADSKHTPKYNYYFGRTHDGDHRRHQHKSEWINENQWFNHHWPLTRQPHRNVQHTIKTAADEPSANRLQLPLDNSPSKINANATNSRAASDSMDLNIRWMRANVSSRAHSNRGDDFAIHTKRHSKRKHRASLMQLIDDDTELSRYDSSFDIDMHHMHHHGHGMVDDAVQNANRMTSKLYANADDSSFSNVSTIASELIHWPIKKEAIMEGDLILGGLMMVHSREELLQCGPIMPQGIIRIYT